MIRHRYPPRKSQIGRNPSNLTVVPTNPPVNNFVPAVIQVNPVVLPKNPVLPKSPVIVSKIPVNKPKIYSALPKNPAVNNFIAKRKRYRNRARKRRRKRGGQFPTAEVPSDKFHWVNNNNNNNNVNQVDKSENKNPVNEENTEKAYQNVSENDNTDVEYVKDVEIVDLAENEENVNETPADDNCFEEVEVASFEGEEKQILVGFRKTKLYYLNYKKKHFFKPKIYELASQRTNVNCLNVGDNVSVDVDVDVDVVSEAEYEYEADNADQGDSDDMFGKILEIEEEPMNDEDQKEDDEDQKENNEDQKEDDENQKENDEDHKEDENDLKGKEKDLKENKEDLRGEDKENEKDLRGEDKDLQENKKELKGEDKDHKGEDKNHKREDKDQKEDITEMIEKVDNNADPVQKRSYKTCIKAEENGFLQGKSFIQDKLDSWMSHLIGLEYLIEIQNKNKDSVENYHCVLCENDLQIQGLPEVCVINHVSGREHVIKYLAKHFPEFYNSFSEKSELNFFTLQKFCELVNEKVGHYFMCITNLDYYSVNEKKIKEVIRDASHPCETNMDFDKSNFLKKIDSELAKELNSVLYDMIEKIQKNDVKSVDNDIPVVLWEKGIPPKSEQISKTQANVAPKPYLPKYKENSAVASFLRLRYAARTKFGQSSSKKPPSKVGAASNKNKKSEIEKKLPESEKKPSDAEKKSTEVAVKSPVEEKSPGVEKKSPGVETKSPGIKAKSPVVEKKSPEVKKKVSESVEKKSSECVKGDQKENDLSKDSLGGEKVKKLGKDSLKKVISEGATESVKTDAQSNVPEEIEVIVIEDNSEELVHTEEIPSNSTTTEVSAYEKSPKVKGKMLMKPTVHSKHCHKRILDSRLRTSTKASGKKQLISSFSNKPKNLPNTKVVVSKSSKEVTSEKSTEHNKQIKVIGGSHKKPHSHKTSCLHALKSSAIDSAAKHSNVHHKNTSENLSKDNSSVSDTDTLSQWIPMRDLSSPVLKPPASDMSHLFSSKSVRKHSKSPLRRITSPLRVVRSLKSPIRNHSSPHRKKSRSPVRRHKSRSPVRRYSRSPLRHSSRSPHRRYSRSPMRRHSRSPLRRHSRSPLRRRSRSPLRRRSRSPLRKRSRSPLRRRSRSPLRRRSRSPLRKHSRSPFRRHSRSPFRRLSRSPLRLSRSPLRRHSRSPLRRNSRSPFGKYSRSPTKGYLGSSVRKRSISPIHSESSMYRSLHKVHSPIHRHSSSSRERKSPNAQFSNTDYEFHKYVDSLESELAKMKSKSERNKKSDKFKSSSFSSSSLRGVSDLDPISDEDESVYFGDKRPEDAKTSSSSSKTLLSRLLQKFSMSDANLNDPALNKLMQFMEAHSNEIEEFVGSQSTSKSSKINETKIDPLALHERTLLLQQFLLSNLAGNTLQQGPSSFAGLHNIPKFMQTPLQDNFIPGFGLPPPISNMQTVHNPNMQHPLQNPNMQHPLPTPNMQQPPPPTPNMHQPPPLAPNMQPPHALPQQVQPTVFPPNVNVPPPSANVNVPPPQFFNQPTNFNQPRPDFSLKRKVPPDVMFKDLKATVNKLFGANEGRMKQEKTRPQMPGYVTEPDPEKWDLNRSDVPGGSKNVSPLGKNFSGMADRPNMREVSPYNKNNKNARNTPEQLYSENMDRPRIPNVPIPPPDAKVSFCDMPSSSSKGNLFPVVNNPRAGTSYNSSSRSGGGVSDVKVSLAQRLASVLVKVGMIDVPAPLLQEMLMKIGAFSSSPRQNISESEILTILKRLGYL